ncbi:MAG: hypothetical protein ACO3XO_06030 [Bdellovibrionota bacterium]|jgi:hypothetical protein
MTKQTFFLTVVALCNFVIMNLATPDSSWADSPYVAETDYDAIHRSPKDGWGELVVVEEEKEPLPLYAEILLWPVNRVLDLVDVVRIDIGAGSSYGGVMRITRQGSVGYRKVEPGSLRVGSFGRKSPLLLEKENEFGVGQSYEFSEDRDVCEAEFGIGLDLFLGGYIGLCPEGIVDLFAGIFFLDPDNDDIR